MNEAAERLRIGLHNASPENFDYIRAVARVDLDAALAAERRATVERIRAAATGEPMQQPLGTGTISGSGIWLADLMVILDGEAAP